MALENERRRSLRYAFIADARVTDTLSDATVAARLNEISTVGCYLDMMLPLHCDTPVHIEITFEGNVFKADGKVVYSQENMGMGVEFTETSPDNKSLLDSWIHTLSTN